MTAPVGVSWVGRDVPLAPRAAAGMGDARRRLVRRLRELPEERLSRLEGVAGEDLVVVLGEAVDLPWVEGVVYLGRSEEAPSLLMPTALAPSIPEALLERAVRRLAGSAAPPLAVLPDRATIASVAAARPLTRGSLEAVDVERPSGSSASRP